MDEMGFESCKADPDFLFFSAMKDNGTYCYKYVLLYTNYILSIMQNSEYFIRHDLGKIFFVNPNSIKPPTQYLGNIASYVTLGNVQSTLSFRSS